MEGACAGMGKAEYPAVEGGAGMYEAESSTIEKDSDINGGAP